MDLDSCFGPLGRSRIVCNASGGAIIAKDSQLLLPHYVDDVSDGFERFVCQESMKAASRWGDGLNSSLILTRSFTAQLSAEINSGGSESTRQRKRSRLLYAVQAVRSACAQSRDDIRLCMIECNLWHVESSVEKWISSICRSTAHPSTNAAIAEHVASLMVMRTCRTYLCMSPAMW
ncbi:hypothetical protein B484DRAFT_149106 [Ochromonadaceae sp. CCMP2298]|nr:hypothetical protein B484DRAFT_149106 [Ochromonadaceae sp. CCMP2298]